MHTGLGTYIYNLITELRCLRVPWLIRGIVRADSISMIAPFVDAIEVLDTPIYTIREQLQVPWAARRSNLLHVPHYNVPLLFRGKLVVTIHDLIHLMDDNTPMKARAYARVMTNTAARKAEQIITVSEFSKTQLIERLGVQPAKITVIPNGVARRFRPLDEHGYVRRREMVRPKWRYFLYVGNLKPHKNLVRLLRAVALFLRKTQLAWKLLVVGRGTREETNQLLEHSSRLGITHSVMFLNDVTDEMLPELYSRAEFCVLPSLLEGFGLPVLESMASGTPVVCSRTASLPEVGGDAARYFDPLDVEDMATAIEAVATSAALRCALRDKGFQQAARFSWSRSARRHADLYDYVLRD